MTAKLILALLAGLWLTLPVGFAPQETAGRRLALADHHPAPVVENDRTAPSGALEPAPDAWCDRDRDGFCAKPFGPDCDDKDPLTCPGIEERADLKDNNCNGFADEPPVGFAREDYTMQGAATAVKWYGDYVYLTAAAVLQVYHAPPGSPPQLIQEIEFRDWVREMSIGGSTLFVAARGDGLFAFDLAGDPAHPQPAGQVTGILNVPGYGNVEAVFNGVDAAGNRVAVARGNNVGKSQGGVDVLVFDYDPTARSFTLVRALGTDVRSNTTTEVPVTVGLTGDGNGLYVGYGILVGELVYVPLDAPGDPILRKNMGAIMDIQTLGDAAFVAITRLDWPWVPVSMLSRVNIVSGELVEKPIVTNPGSSAGNAVDIHGDLLCFGTWSPGRYEAGRYNLWAFTDLDQDTPTRLGAAGTLDWLFQLACRDAETGPDWIYVADEWGGLEVWQSQNNTLTLDLDQQRIPTGALSFGLFNDGSRVYSVKEGAGLWVYDEPAPHAERPVVEWIDRADPGCACEGCCPPAVGTWPYPPAVFVSAGALSQGRVALLAQDRNTAVPGASYLMLFEENAASGRYQCLYSDPAPAQSGNMVKTFQTELLFATTAAHALRAYQHCPAAANPVRILGEIPMPTQEKDLLISDVAVYGDYLFVTEVHDAPLAAPDAGKVHVYRWKQGDLATCPTQPALLNPPAYLGSFAGDLIPYRLLLDAGRNQLIVGAAAKSTFPIKEGGLFFYDLSSFDPGNPADLDRHRTNRTANKAIRVTYANIYGLLLNGDSLLVVDLDNGLYEYSFSAGAYTRFYPAQRGPASQLYVPQLVRSPAGVVPLYHPIAVTLTPAGKIVVQEHTVGRMAILARR
jgi:hypothetical protein